MINSNVKKVIEEIAAEPSFDENPCFFIYNLADIRHKLNFLKNRPANVSLYYAMKANTHAGIINFMRSVKSLDGIEIASSGELDKIAPLFGPEEIIFTGPGKTSFELEKSLDYGIRLINLESIVEAKRISILAKEKKKSSIDVLVRINTDYCLEDAIENMGGKPTHMGIDQKTIIESLNKIRSFGNLNVMGYHVFSASGVLDYKKLLGYVDYVFALTKEVDRKSHSDTKIIDFGGGFGIDCSGKGKQFNISGFFNGLKDHTDKYGFKDKELILELGTYIVGESGYYISEILDIKETKGKKHIITAGGTNHLRRPIAVGINQPTYVLPRNKPSIIANQTEVHDEIVNVCGPLCYADDKIAVDINVKRARIGDLVVITQSGAYGYDVSAVNFLSHMGAPEYVLDCDKYFSSKKSGESSEITTALGRGLWGKK